MGVFFEKQVQIYNLHTINPPVLNSISFCKCTLLRNPHYNLVLSSFPKFSCAHFWPSLSSPPPVLGNHPSVSVSLVLPLLEIGGFYLYEMLSLWASLVAQWLTIHLPMQGTRVWALVREDPTCCGATKPMCHNYWAWTLELASHNYWAHVPQLLKSAHLEPVLRNKRSHCNEKPAHCNEE